ncbi:protein SHQ1 homolog [Astyanax mexicanus]|uniref:protein SHQ1 homolog n=1 Tax=Astyanax mexicanus TaxID=7994 RepID=UPI0020CADC68|nr:protein SHQ1 homolog [Astyanax mexicanus]
MITPAFELSQDPDYLTLVIRVPYTRTSEFDVYIDGEDFKFYAKPYFLRLTLPGRIVQDGREKASFDIDKGLFTMRVPKETAGQDFEGLQMLTSLLAPKGCRSAKPLVEDVGTSGRSEADEDEDEDEDEEEDFDWQVEQEPYVESSEDDLKKLQKYGFGNLRTGVFSRLQEELSDVIDLEDPENSTPAMRRSSRLNAETTIFCADHYLCDLYEGEETRQIHLEFKPWWSELKPDADLSEPAVIFTDDEKEQMRKFTNRSYLLDKATRHQVWLGLVDVILAYVYDVRTTEGEHNVESAWTIRKLSGTLSWLETYHSVQEVLVSFGRRVLCYPLHRHFSLITTAVRDAAHIFQCGKACVLKCLLSIHKIFRENEPAYILNDLYISDYCVWIQRVKSRHVVALADPLRKSELQKDHLDLELIILEKAAELVVEEEEEEKKKERKEEETSSSSSSEEEEEEDSTSSSEEEEEKEAEKDNSSVFQSSETQERRDQLIQELSERMEEGLRMEEEDVPQSSRPSSSLSSQRPAGDASPSSAATAAGGGGGRTSRALVDISGQSQSCRKTLNIVDTEDLDSDDEEDEYEEKKTANH